MTKNEALAAVVGPRVSGRATDKAEVKRAWDCRHKTPGECLAAGRGNVAIAGSYRHAYAGYEGTCEEPEPFVLRHETADGEDWVGHFLEGMGTHYLVPVKDVRVATGEEVARYTRGAYKMAGYEAWQLSSHDFWKGEEE